MHIENVVGLMFVKIDIGMLILAILVSMLVNVPQSKLSFVWNFNPAHLRYECKERVIKSIAYYNYINGIEDNINSDQSAACSPISYVYP